MLGKGRILLEMCKGTWGTDTLEPFEQVVLDVKAFGVAWRWAFGLNTHSKDAIFLVLREGEVLSETEEKLKSGSNDLSRRVLWPIGSWVAE